MDKKIKTNKNTGFRQFFTLFGHITHLKRHCYLISQSLSCRSLLVSELLISSVNVFLGLPLFLVLLGVKWYIFFGNLFSFIFLAWSYRVKSLVSIYLLNFFPIIIVYLFSSFGTWFHGTNLKRFYFLLQCFIRNLQLCSVIVELFTNDLNVYFKRFSFSISLNEVYFFWSWLPVICIPEWRLMWVLTLLYCFPCFQQPCIVFFLR